MKPVSIIGSKKYRKLTFLLIAYSLIVRIVAEISADWNKRALSFVSITQMISKLNWGNKVFLGSFDRVRAFFLQAFAVKITYRHIYMPVQYRNQAFIWKTQINERRSSRYIIVMENPYFPGALTYFATLLK